MINFFLRSSSRLCCLLFLVFLTLTNAFLVASNFWLSEWSDDALKKETPLNKFYRLMVYITLGVSRSIKILKLKSTLSLILIFHIFKGLFSLFFEISFISSFIMASKYLHDLMLTAVLKSKIQFFESTPVGRILNRNLFYLFS